MLKIHGTGKTLALSNIYYALRSEGIPERLANGILELLLENGFLGSSNPNDVFLRDLDKGPLQDKIFAKLEDELSSPSLTDRNMNHSYGILAASIEQDKIAKNNAVEQQRKILFQSDLARSLSRVRTHNQKITAAARAIAERKTVGDLS